MVLPTSYRKVAVVFLNFGKSNSLGPQVGALQIHLVPLRHCFVVHLDSVAPWVDEPLLCLERVSTDTPNLLGLAEVGICCCVLD